MWRISKEDVLCAADNDGRTEGMVENMGKRLCTGTLESMQGAAAAGLCCAWRCSIRLATFCCAAQFGALPACLAVGRAV